MELPAESFHSIIVPSGEIAAETEEVAHEALLGAELPVEETKKIATVATLGNDPFQKGGEDVEHHAIVATEIVRDPCDQPNHDPVLQNAV
eukprot:10505236-Ditylum_brightwellii.AAC.1